MIDPESGAAVETGEFVDDLEVVEIDTPVKPNWLKRYSLGLLIAGLIAVFVALVFWQRMVITVHAGEEAVIWRRFRGTDLSTVYLEGTHVILPWNIMSVYDVRIAKVSHTAEVLSADGLNISIDLAIQYYPVRKMLPYLHQQVGPDYVNRIVIPEVLTAVREVVGKYRPQELYTISTEATEQQIVSIAAERIRGNYVELRNVLIARITLPPLIENGIQRKLAQEQEALEYVFRLDKEAKEKERKRIEAEGIRDWERTIKEEISPEVLQYKGIEATLELAKSPNSKVVVVGSGKGGLPVVLNPQ